jgi:kinesin family protein 18/19
MDHKLVILMDPGERNGAVLPNDYLRQDKSREKRYAFDSAFGPEVGTHQIFTATTKPLIGAVMQAYNATVFAYGATGAGKTYSMIGTAQAPGVMLLTIGALFDEARDIHKAATVKCSFVEVYNENLRDLLAPERTGYLDLREDPGKGMVINNVFETQAESVHEVMELIRKGNQHRSTEPTAMNVTSSRSHAVLQVTVEQLQSHQPNEVMLGKLSLIDLAGSERASQTHNRGERLVEGANINRSLLALGNCINALASGCGFVPYRDSKLTRMLKDSLGGNCRTIMMANISPNHVSYEDTLNTLKYANRAKNIRITARQNIMKPETHVSQYQQMIEDLRGEVQLLKAKLANQRPQVLQSLGTEEAGAAAEEAGANWKAEMVQNLESRTQLQRSLIEVDRGLDQWYVEKDRACSIISKWDEGDPSSPRSRNNTHGAGRWSQPSSLEEWHDRLQQVEESIRENLDTRKSIQERLAQNKTEGKELQAQLPHRVLNDDLRTFLELIQRVQVLEVERLELDHVREVRRTQLEERDSEIEQLKEQLRLRNEHLVAQRQLLSDENKKIFPRSVSLLGSTLSETSPGQKRGPIMVMHAWAPPRPKESDEVANWDGRPLREREPSIDDRDIDDIQVDWRNVELPHASQIRGIAQIQPPLGRKGIDERPGQGPKGWREPPHFKHNPDLGLPRPPRLQESTVNRQCNKPHTGGPVPVSPVVSVDGSAAAYPPPVPRGRTCPPLRRTSPEHASLRRPSQEEPEDLLAAPRPRVQPPPRLAVGDFARAQGIAAPPRRVRNDITPKSRRRSGIRARSEHSDRYMNKVGRMVLAPR